MANENKTPVMTASVQVGPAHAYRGDLFTANSMAALGMVQGPITIRHGAEFSDLRLEDQTGPMVLDRIAKGEDLSVTIPLVMPADPTTVWPNIQLTGTRGFGFSTPQKPTYTSLAIIPDFEIAGGLLYNGTTWTRLAGNGVGAGSGGTVAPKHGLFIWRAQLTYGDRVFQVDEGGRQILEVTAQAFFSFNVGVPEGAKLGIIGDPTTFSPAVTGFFFGSTTP